MADTRNSDRWRQPLVRGLGWCICVGVWTAALLTSTPAEVGKEMAPAEVYFHASKLLHVGAYAFLTAFLAWLPLRRGRWLLLAFLSLHAAGTEFLQQFVPGRTGKVADVVIDHVGLLLGLALTWKCWLPRSAGHPLSRLRFLQLRADLCRPRLEEHPQRNPGHD